ncbi:hypothetical protein [Streptomyces rhizosphaerihabitans]|uniref:hypothetical protein n=1 Tax=Streptomyces rhizosphaerihabitans TaxID=1266770 RepID=UPI0021BFAC47|nr:hypothetical protein [Streptomyces rhizosphaerihabitans]MCT9010000.1 hypothetical protein [Streptomyces rhizosphaerihabitans]
MKWLLLGALLGLLIAFPPLLAMAVAVVVAVLSKPVLTAFGLGLAVRVHLPRLRRWTS